jgi:hypothetical protein
MTSLVWNRFTMRMKKRKSTRQRGTLGHVHQQMRTFEQQKLQKR